MAWAVDTPITKVWPSVDLAVTSAARVLDAPGRFSTTTLCLSSGPRRSATARAMASVPPPGAEPTSSFTGWRGHSWAEAVDTAVPSVAARLQATARCVRDFMVLSPVYRNKVGVQQGQMLGL